MRDDETAELSLLREAAADIAVHRVGPLVREIEDGAAFSHPLLGILREAGWLGMVVPERFGGVDVDIRSFVITMEELSKVFPTASTILTGHWFSTKLIVKWAEGDWVGPFLSNVAEGQGLGALAFTEPDAGSDLGAVSTKAVRVDGGWEISGAKRFITNGGYADYYTVLARTGDPGSRDLSLFMVDADRPGVTAGALEKKMGLRGSATAEMFFDNVLVPDDRLIGVQGRGFHQAMDGFLEGRIIVAALSLGIAEGALQHAVTYAQERKQFGRSIGSFQGLQFLIADMAIQTQAARSLVYDAADAVLAGSPNAARLASIAKTFASDVGMSVTTDAVQVLGGYGYVHDFPVEMLMRDAKINQIYEGTNQIQRVLIARDLLGPAARE